MVSRSLGMVIFLIFVNPVFSQYNFSEAERIQGYKISDGNSIFIFDESIYNKKPEKQVFTCLSGKSYDSVAHRRKIKTF